MRFAVFVLHGTICLLQSVTVYVSPSSVCTLLKLNFQSTYFLFLLLAFDKFFEPNGHFARKMDSGPNQSATSRLFYISFCQSVNLAPCKLDTITLRVVGGNQTWHSHLSTIFVKFCLARLTKCGSDVLPQPVMQVTFLPFRWWCFCNSLKRSDSVHYCAAEYSITCLPTSRRTNAQQYTHTRPLHYCTVGNCLLTNTSRITSVYNSSSIYVLIWQHTNNTALVFFPHKHQHMKHTALHSQRHGGCKFSRLPTDTNKLPS
jgi:hypothetical protein